MVNFANPAVEVSHEIPVANWPVTTEFKGPVPSEKLKVVTRPVSNVELITDEPVTTATLSTVMVSYLNDWLPVESVAVMVSK